MRMQRLVRNRLVRALLHTILPVCSRPDLVRLGTSYGGWWVPSTFLRPGAIAYCAGVGEDITFDLALVTFGCEVWAFDPTPRVVSWVHDRSTPSSWHFFPVGLWTAPGSIRFYEPANPSHVSYSATNAQQTATWIDLSVDTVPRLMRRFAHDHVDLLKMDIEGAEGPVLRHMLAEGIRPTILCVEFDQPEVPWRLVGRVRELLDAGYVLLKIDRWNYTFLRADSR